MKAEVIAKWKLGCAEIIFAEDENSKFLLTKFEDETFVVARPVSSEPWDWFHDLFHSALAAHLGWCHSPTLWRLAHSDSSCTDNFVAYEEAAVLALQNVANDERR